MTDSSIFEAQMIWVFGIIGMAVFVLAVSNAIRPPENEVPQKNAKRNGKMAGSGNPEEKNMRKIATFFVLLAVFALALMGTTAKAWDREGAVFVAISKATIEAQKSSLTETRSACVSPPTWFKSQATEGGNWQFYKVSYARKSSCASPTNEVKTLWFTESGAAVLCNYSLGGTIQCLVEDLGQRTENLVNNHTSREVAVVNGGIGQVAATQNYMLQRDQAVGACKARVLDHNNKARGCMQMIDMGKTTLVYIKKGEYDIRQDRLYQAASELAGAFACPKIVDINYCEDNPTLFIK